MKNRLCALVALLLFVGSAVGCASRTKIVAGPLQAGGSVQVFDEPQALEFVCTPENLGLTFGFFEINLQGGIVPCEKIIGLEHSTGDPEKVFGNSGDPEKVSENSN